MNEPKHTPGPWEARDVAGAGWSVRKRDERPGYTGHAPICSMAWWQFDIPGIIDDEISEANAKLIAAAPMMYEALKAAESCIETPGDLTADEIKWVLEDIRVAISLVESGAIC